MLRRGMMLQVSGGGSGGRLPAGFQEVESIASDGACYIDTGIQFNQGILVEARMGWNELADGAAAFGARRNTSGNRFLVALSGSNSNISYAYGSGRARGRATAGTLYDFVMDARTSGEITYGEAGDTTTASVTNASSNATGYIFAYHMGTPDEPRSFSVSTFVSMKITNAEGETVFNGVPCYRIQDGVIGIYDMISGSFLPNLGTGSLSKGPDVN